MNPTDQARKCLKQYSDMHPQSPVSCRKGSPKKGTKEKQKTAANGPSGCIERKRSPSNSCRFRENRSNGYAAHCEINV